MIIQWSKRMTSFLVYQKIIEREDKEVYEYGLQLLLSTVINGLIALFIAAVSKMVVPCLLYLTVFVIMRKSAGGFHAKTHFRCCCILIVVLSCFILFIKFAPNNIYFIVSDISIFISAAAIWFLAPLEHENKPLGKDDKIRLRKMSIVYMIVIFIFIIFFRMFNLETFMISIVLGILTSSVSMLVAEAERKWKRLHLGTKKRHLR